VPVEDEREPFLDEVADAVVATVRKGERDPDKRREAIRLAARRVATRWTGKKPVVDVMTIGG
jgi:ribonuclease J